MAFNNKLRFKMSNTSRPHRIEVLESNVGGMKAELSYIRARTGQMMGIMQQLLQTKSTYGGQQDDKSGGSSRGDPNDDSGGAGRVPREEGFAGTRVGATTASAAGERVSNHSNRASDRSIPADDTDRRPEVPTGVGPMITMECGEARD